MGTNTTQLGEVMTLLHSNYFYEKPHQFIYSIVMDLYSQGLPIDVLTVAEGLKKLDCETICGGVSYLTELLDSGVLGTNLLKYAHLITDNYYTRLFMRTCEQAIAQCQDGKQDVRQIIAELEGASLNILEQTEGMGMVYLSDLVQEEMVKLKATDEAVAEFIAPTGFDGLDEVIDGLYVGDVVVVAARTSMGKSALAMNIADNVASAGVPVGMFSLEMTNSSMVKRLLAKNAGVDNQRIRKKNIFPTEWQVLEKASEDLQKAVMIFPKRLQENLSPISLASQIRLMRLMQPKLSLVVVDYIQLMTPDERGSNEVEEVKNISRAIKRMALSLGVCILLISQFRKGREEQIAQAPTIRDIYGSSFISNDADTILLLHQDKEDISTGYANTTIYIPKARNGKCGEAKLAFVGNYTRFDDWYTVGSIADTAITF